MYAKQDKPQNGAEVLKFFDWALKNGQKMAEELDYVPLPQPVVAQIESAWKARDQGPVGQGALVIRRAARVTAQTSARRRLRRAARHIGIDGNRRRAPGPA